MLVSPVVCSVYAGFIRVEFCTFKTGSKSIVGEKKHKICSQKLNLLLCILLLDCVVFRQWERDTEFFVFSLVFLISYGKESFSKIVFFFPGTVQPSSRLKIQKSTGSPDVASTQKRSYWERLSEPSCNLHQGLSLNLPCLQKSERFHCLMLLIFPCLWILCLLNEQFFALLSQEFYFSRTLEQPLRRFCP